MIDTSSSPSLRTDQTLIFDADDTLWECNAYFENSIQEFMDFLHNEHLSREAIREVLDNFERRHGYGARAFARSMVDTYRELAPENDPGDEERIERLGLRILEQEMAPIADVDATLRALMPHHSLLLFTKGDEEEQQIKINRSTLTPYFEMTIVTHDKTVSTYRDIVDGMGLEPRRTWMIGNSQRSDILPALAAGINAIYIPNPHTWHLEHSDVEHDDGWPGTFIELERFAELTTIFASSR